jgi:bacillolysin
MTLHIKATAALVAATVALTGQLAWAGAQTAPDPDDRVATGRPQDPPRISRQDETGKVGFIGTGIGAPIETGAAATDPPAAVARAFLLGRAAELGLSGRSSGLLVAGQRRTPGGGSAVRLTQAHAGIPVLGGEFAVSLDADRNVLSVLGEASPIGTVPTTPEVDSAEARRTAMAAVARAEQVAKGDLTALDPVLSFYDPRLLGAPGPFQSARLAWVSDVRSTGPVAATNRKVVIDAATGSVALTFSNLAQARNRIVCDAGGTTDEYPCTTALAEWTEGSTPATANTDVSSAYEYAGDTYDFFAGLGRDSLDGAGMQLKSTVDYCPDRASCPYENAFWDGSQMVYGDGFASADDVVGHELTHGVTDFSSSLFYYMQSGAINESMSDVFGEYVDLVNGAGTDTPEVRWLMGEDIPGFGALRDMEDPTAFGDPDRMLSPDYDADPSESDGGGVHVNSGVNNKAAYLITDGGTFNGQTITGLGITKAARIYHTVNTTMLVSASDYADLATALRQACRNLAGTGTDGITAADCEIVDRAVLATEMDQNPTAAPTATTSVCPSGTAVTSTILADDLESSTGQLTATAITGPNAWYYPQNPNPFFDATYATSGSTNIWGDNADVVSDSAIRMTNAVPIPAGAHLHFNHAFGFDDAFQDVAWDGGVVEYSTGGASGPWVDAGSLFAASGGAGGYTGTVSSGSRSPLANRAAFVRESNGYGASRADLSSLAGQSVMFRWRIGTDEADHDYGWFLDDLRIVTCAAPAPPPTTSPTTAPPTTAPPTPAPPAPAPGDTTAPRTRITQHPTRTTTARKVRFAFRADEAATFRCKLDKQKWTSCSSPKRYKRLGPGRHTFRVYSIDRAGNTDPTPAVWKWKVRR